MNISTRKSVTLAGMATLFALLFTQQGTGFNIFLFTLAWLVISPVLRPYNLVGYSARLAVFCLLWSSICWAVFDSLIARFVYGIAFVLVTGTVQGSSMRFLGYPFLLGISSWLLLPWSATHLTFGGVRRKALSRWIATTALPLLLMAIFLLIYWTGNPGLARWLGSWRQFGHWMIWSNWLVPYLLMGLTGLFVLLPLAIQHPWAPMIDRQEKQWRSTMHRQVSRSSGQFPIMALKQEYLCGLLSLAGLNGILLIVNVLDVYAVWLGQRLDSPQELSAFVHQGTAWLILSILLAGLVLLWIFRGNLNFFPANRWLTGLAYFWLAQNACLALSVGLRNAHYTHLYGLTYLRIGLFFFLLLVLLGLWSLARKVAFRQTVYGWLSSYTRWVLIAFAMLASFSWDTLLTRYNVQAIRQEHLDVAHLFDLASAKNLPILEANRDLLLAAGPFPEPELDQLLREKRLQLIHRWDRKGSLGFSLQDWWVRADLRD